MKIYQDNTNKDIILREDEIDIEEELQEKLGITFRKMGEHGTLSKTQLEYMYLMKDWILDDFWTELDPEDLYDDLADDGDYDTIGELGLDKDNYTGEVEVK